MAHNALALNWQMSQVSEAKRNKVMLWESILKEFDVAENRGIAVLALQEKYGLKFSLATLYGKYNRWKELGKAGLLPKPIRNRAAEEDTKFAKGFTAFWMQLCAQNQRKTAPAWRTLIEEHLVSGKVIPGYETDWRGIFALEHPGWAIPESCPYSRKAKNFPRGWSQRNLQRYALTAYQAAAVRQGTAAARNYLPTIPTTRVGLPFGRVYIIDDMHHDVLVSFLGNMEPRGVVELGALELLTGHYCSYGVKPVRERLDGTRENLNEDLNRYLAAHIACGIGFSSDGCTICGEHGTAKLPGDLVSTLTRLSGGLIEFTAGGILNMPIAKGLYMGARRGNFRFKAALESHHALKKNELAQLPGQKGADPEHQPEDLPSKTQHHKHLMKAVLALAESRPDLIEEIASDFPLYYKYIEAVGLLYERIANRYEHDLEAWEELGFTRAEWRITGNDLWKPQAELDKMSEADREAIRTVIRANPTNCFRQRRMSPAEAFQHCRTVYADRIHRLPEYCVPEILGGDLADKLEVQQNGTIMVPNKYLPTKPTQVAAMVKYPDGSIETLLRGRELLVWLSPLDARNAYISTRDGIYLGVAPVMIPGTKIDEHAFHRNVAILNAMEHQELKRLEPVANERMRERARMAEKNIKAIKGKTAAEVMAADDKAIKTAADADEAFIEMYGR